MPILGSRFSGLVKERHLTDEKFIEAICFSPAEEYEPIQFFMQPGGPTGKRSAVAERTVMADEEREHAEKFLRLLSENIDP